ncbi:hypothetical protein D7Z94_03315 [Ulvibacterium marinum]|uniref:Uncharacterized protein n=1 Tax=Ulvibacterium marinum TaxID=2419782 RepID=A0A3B0CAT0_9FLAO|nr:hypothetical protein D7Z94_03315 [Ulvibacterium marinum]
MQKDYQNVYVLRWFHCDFKPCWIYGKLPFIKKINTTHNKYKYKLMQKNNNLCAKVYRNLSKKLKWKQKN